MKGLLHRISSTLRDVRRSGGVADDVGASTIARQHREAGVTHHRAGRLVEAELSYRQVLAFEPTSDAAHNALGVVLQQRGEVADARASFLAAVRLNSANFEAQNNLGNSWLESGDLDRAEACYRAALAVQPDFVATRMNLGGLFKRRGELDTAADCYRSVLGQHPGNADALNNLGAVHLAAGRLADAEEALRRAVDANPRLTEGHSNLADTMLALGKHEEAERYCRQALELRPGFPDALNTLALLFKRSDLDRAEAVCREAIAADSRRSSFHNNLGTILRARGDRAGAEASFRSALRLDPDAATSKYNLANLLLLQGDYERGFELYESRFGAFGDRIAHARQFERDLGRDRRWRGQPLSGARVLVWTEQGFGDSLMMLRYLPLLKSHGAAKVLVVCQPELARLVDAMPTVDRVVTRGDELSRDDFDLQCPIMSLPYGFKTRQDSVPGRVPYLSVPRDLTEAWGKRLSGTKALKVGLAWAGSKTLGADSSRSIALSRLAPILDTPGVQVVSLQKSDDTTERPPAEPRMLDWMRECVDFMDTAALVENLDLVISVDTAVAHLAGALGRAVWLLNRFESEWRWGLDTDRSAWYPTMRIFTQYQVDQWEDVIHRVAAELRRVARDPRDERLPQRRKLVSDDHDE